MCLCAERVEGIMKITDKDSEILNRIQRDISISENPFLELSLELDLSADKLLAALAQLKKRGIIRSISGIFNAESLGYQISLVAFEVPEDNIGDAAELINSHPGVSHNYLRDHRYNIWFTLAVETGRSLEETVSLLARGAHSRDSLILRNERMMKIGLMLNAGAVPLPDGKTAQEGTPSGIAEEHDFSEDEREAVRLLQMDLLLEERPFRSIINCERSFLSEVRLIELGTIFKNENIMRRFSAVLRHRTVGYTSNAMTVWRINGYDTMDDVADIFLGEQSISHLYLRTVYPGKWEYPLFAMIHSKSSVELRKIIERLSKRSGFKDYLVLNSLKEFKKQRVAYFSDAFSEWERNNYD